MLAALVLVSAGCQSANDTANAEDTSKKSSPKKETSAPADKIPLEVASWEQTQKIIAENKGKIVVLDLWSTWCEPCVREFPGLVALQKKFPNDVVCVSLNTNYIGTGSPEDERDEILGFLTKNKATIRNLISSDADEDLYKKVGIASIPVAQVYGRDGKLVKQFDNEKEEYGDKGFSYEEHITPLVKSLVEKK
jgi:thiol-disulfide isomerase/thioredoxin